MANLKIGIFGVGRGLDLARDFLNNGCDIVALCDSRRDKLEEAAKRLGGDVAIYEDFDAFINDPNREPLKSECLLPNTVGKMINAGKCDCEILKTSAKWFGVTYSEDKPDVIAKLKALIESGEYPNGLWK